MKKSKLRELIREEIKLLSEKENWTKYLKLLGYDSNKFKKLDPHTYKFYMDKYKKSSEASDFEQNYLDNLERDINKIAI